MLVNCCTRASVFVSEFQLRPFYSQNFDPHKAKINVYCTPVVYSQNCPPGNDHISHFGKRENHLQKSLEEGMPSFVSRRVSHFCSLITSIFSAEDQKLSKVSIRGTSRNYFFQLTRQPPPDSLGPCLWCSNWRIFVGFLCLYMGWHL